MQANPGAAFYRRYALLRVLPARGTGMALIEEGFIMVSDNETTSYGMAQKSPQPAFGTVRASAPCRVRALGST
jgi:hypothetical protein